MDNWLLQANAVLDRTSTLYSLGQGHERYPRRRQIESQLGRAAAVVLMEVEVLVVLVLVALVEGSRCRL